MLKRGFGVSALQAKKEEKRASTKFNPPRLRKWQAEAIEVLTERFARKKEHLGVLTCCTGAGKTMAATEIAFRLLSEKTVDLIIVLAPTNGVARGWVEAFNKYPGVRAVANSSVGPVRTGGSNSIKAKGTNVWVMTYPGYKKALELLNGGDRVIQDGLLLICDEYHHAECNYVAKLADSEAPSRLWGEAVEELDALSKYTLMLSGTPWKEEGSIALLERAGRYESAPNGDVLVRADYEYLYSDDLSQAVDEDRGTVPAYFTFVPSKAVDKKTGKVDDFGTEDDLPPEDSIERASWLQEARLCTSPMSSHVSAKLDTLADCPAVPRMLLIGAKKLQQSREEVEKASDGALRDATVMLYVASSQAVAEKVAQWINGNLGLSAVVIHSKMKDCSGELDKIRKQIDANDPEKPDIIVSVGMISEGVDIPRIKVVVYGSAILTLLYLLQVIGRMLRRIIYAQKGIDRFIDQTPGYFVSVGHPRLIYMASELEKQIRRGKENRKIQGQDGEETSEQPKVSPAKDVEVTSEGAVREMYRGEMITAIAREVMSQLLDHPDARLCLVNRYWEQYVMSMFLEKRTQDALEEIRSKCSCLNEDFDKIAGSIVMAIESNTLEGVDDPTPYDVKLAKTKKLLNKVVMKIAYKAKPFCDYPDQVQLNINRAWGLVKREAGFSSNKDYHTSSLEELEKMLNAGRNYFAKNEKIEGAEGDDL